MLVCSTCALFFRSPALYLRAHDYFTSGHQLFISAHMTMLHSSPWQQLQEFFPHINMCDLGSVPFAHCSSGHQLFISTYMIISHCSPWQQLQESFPHINMCDLGSVPFPHCSSGHRLFISAFMIIFIPVTASLSPCTWLFYFQSPALYLCLHDYVTLLSLPTTSGVLSAY